MTEEQRLKRIESMVEEIHALLIMGQAPVPGEAEYERVIEEMLKGNTKPLAIFMQRGGKIPMRHTGKVKGQKQLAP